MLTNVSSCEIRPPRPAEVRACRMILPDAFHRGLTPDLLLAVDSDPFRFLGVAAFTLVLFEGRPAWELRLHVVRGHRRMGHGTHLVRSLIDRGTNRGVIGLIARQ